MDARLGEESEVVTKALRMYAPSEAMRSMLGVSNQGIVLRKPI